jgi:3-hydroxyisobutyrate dehydrogenase
MTLATPLATSEHRHLAFIGLGVMGFPMAGHLAKAGHRVVVYNRDATKVQAWLEAHKAYDVHGAASPALAAKDADVVFACVGNDEALQAVLDGQQGAFAGMKAGSIAVDHSTTSADIARQMSARAAQMGLEFIDAPVSGGQAGAQNGVLTVMCGGDAQAFETIKPVAMAFSRAVTRMGASGAGQLTKMVNQICIAGLLQALSEGIAFGARAGLDLNQVLEVISKGAAQSWQMENRGKTMVAGHFDFGFAVDLMRKDLGLVFQEAQRNGAVVDITKRVDEFYREIQDKGGSRWDTSSLVTRLS